jgi:hypothetical protein
VAEVRGLLAAGDRPLAALDLAVELLALGDDPSVWIRFMMLPTGISE